MFSYYRHTQKIFTKSMVSAAFFFWEFISMCHWNESQKESMINVNGMIKCFTVFDG